MVLVAVNPAVPLPPPRKLPTVALPYAGKATVKEVSSVITLVKTTL
jgi:hypothetical protein